MSRNKTETAKPRNRPDLGKKWPGCRAWPVPLFLNSQENIHRLRIDCCLFTSSRLLIFIAHSGDITEASWVYSRFRSSLKGLKYGLKPTS
ncbi:hypothetical protein BsWGS_26652 [Bradybaena similaris]